MQKKLKLHFFETYTIFFANFDPSREESCISQLLGAAGVPGGRRLLIQELEIIPLIKLPWL